MKFNKYSVGLMSFLAVSCAGGGNASNSQQSSNEKKPISLKVMSDIKCGLRGAQGVRVDGEDNLPLGMSASMSLKLVCNNKMEYDVTPYANWRSENKDIATVSNTSEDKGTVKANAVGTTNIIAVYDKYSATKKISATDAKIKTLALSLSNSSIPLGVQSEIKVTGTFSDGSSRDLSDAKFSINNSNVEVKGNNLVGKKQGSFTLTASYDGVTSEISGTVVDATIVKIIPEAGHETIPFFTAAPSSQAPLIDAVLSDGTTQRIATNSLTCSYLGGEEFYLTNKCTVNSTTHNGSGTVNISYQDLISGQEFQTKIDLKTSNNLAALKVKLLTPLPANGSPIIVNSLFKYQVIGVMSDPQHSEVNLTCNLPLATDDDLTDPTILLSKPNLDNCDYSTFRIARIKQEQKPVAIYAQLKNPDISSSKTVIDNKIVNNDVTLVRLSQLVSSALPNNYTDWIPTNGQLKDNSPYLLKDISGDFDKRVFTNMKFTFSAVESEFTKNVSSTIKTTQDNYSFTTLTPANIQENISTQAYTSFTVMCNNGDTNQTLTSSPFNVSYSVGQSYQQTDTWKVGLKITAKVADIGAELSGEYGQSYQSGTSSSTTKSYTVQAQSVLIPPHGRAYVVGSVRPNSTTGIYNMYLPLTGDSAIPFYANYSAPYLDKSFVYNVLAYQDFGKLYPLITGKSPELDAIMKAYDGQLNIKIAFSQSNSTSISSTYNVYVYNEEQSKSRPSSDCGKTFNLLKGSTEMDFFNRSPDSSKSFN